MINPPLALPHPTWSVEGTFELEDSDFDSSSASVRVILESSDPITERERKEGFISCVDDDESVEPSELEDLSPIELLLKY
jgi:hypothetical protein